MSQELREGTKVRELVFPDNEGVVTVEMEHVESIVVAEQNGQMARVPWAKVTYTDGDVRLINLCHVAAVELLPEDD